MNRLEVALKIAEIAHDGQSYGGEPYLEAHVLAVVAMVQAETDEQDAAIVAALHDVVEDSDITLANLNWFGIEVRDAVDALTKRENESELDYLQRCALNRLASLVKRADILCNLRASKQGTARARKYEQKLALLYEMTPIPCDLIRDDDGTFRSGFVRP